MKYVSHITPYDDARRHYINRLYQRHNIYITESEYDAIMNDAENIMIMYRITNRKELVYVNIKGTYFPSIISRGFKDKKTNVEYKDRLLTCLPNDFKIPRTNKLKYRYTHEEFESKINSYIKDGFDEFYKNPYNFYLNKNIPKVIQGFMSRWDRDGWVDFSFLIRNIENNNIK